MTSTKYRWLTAFAFGLSASYAAAQGTDRRALSAIFDDTHIVDAALPVHRHTASMPAQSRYEHLRRWVLPSADHLSFRLDLEFTPTNPAAVALHDAHRLDVQRLNRARTSAESRVQLGGHLVAPAMDLIAVATELGRLAELRQRIESARIENAAADVQAQQRCRLALLALVDMARGEFDEALASVEQLSSRYLNDRREQFVPRSPETLVCWQGVRHQQTRDATGDLLHLIVQRDIRSGRRPNRWLAWEHQMMALAGLLSHLESEEDSGQANDLYASPPNLKHWAPVSRVKAQSRGRGLPLTRWQFSRDTVQKLAGHQEDYLYFRVPLRGDFEVECDVTSFDFRDTQLLFAGNWVAPSYDLSSYTFGDLRRPIGRRELSPPMSPVDRWMRNRTVVRDGVCTTWLNGRRIHQQTLETAHAEVRVRNVVWRGGWPRVLPDVEQQELARAATDRVDEGLERLSVAVHHDFVKDGLPVDQFVVRTDGEDASKQVVAKPDGLHVTRPGRKGYTNSWVTPQAEIQGDFDITARFENLQFTPSDSGSGGISLTVILENKGYTHGAVHRGAIFDSAAVARHFIQSEFIRSPNGQTRTAAQGTTSDEATSGCLRLARRGEMLYSLFAENDSSQYRLVHEEQVGTENLLFDGIRLSAAVISGGNPSGTTAVVWKELTVRAEKIIP